MHLAPAARRIADSLAAARAHAHVLRGQRRDRGRGRRGRRPRPRRALHSELAGVAAALIGSVLGGTALAGTRFAVGSLDPMAVAAFRYGIGALLLLPFIGPSLPLLYRRTYALPTLGLAFLFFAIYPYTFALALAYTTAVRGSLALASMPLLTLAFAIAIGREALLWRRVIGALIAVAGLAFALSPGIGQAVPGAWRGDLIMVAAAAMQAVYNVLSKPYIERVGALPFTALGMALGGGTLVAVCFFNGNFDRMAGLDPAAWAALLYLGVAGGALLWVLWSVGLRYASASLVALTTTLNALTASFLGAVFLAEPLGVEFAVGLVGVVLGIVVATARFRRAS
jgi:drug/metabolite transporter (DMT)-like permease